MRAVQMSGYGPVDVLELAEVAKPRAGEGEVLVQVVVAAVNPADAKWRAGMFREVAPIGFPHILGYDIAGFVAAVGEGVSGLSVADRVLGMLDPVAKGGYAEFVRMPADAVVVIPEQLDIPTAAALPTAGLTGVQLIEEHIRPRAGQRILITGACGAVGRFAVYAAVKLGATVVAGVRANQVESAIELDASETLVLDDASWRGQAFEHVADTVGGDHVARLCRHLAPGALIRTVATTPIDPEGLSSEPRFVAMHQDTARLSALAAEVAAGRVDVPIARRLPLEEAREAHRLVESGGLGGKVVLEI